MGLDAAAIELGLGAAACPEHPRLAGVAGRQSDFRTPRRHLARFVRAQIAEPHPPLRTLAPGAP